MDKILDRVGDDRMARVPAIKEERAAVLADAIEFYQTLLRLDSADPVVRVQTADMYARVGRTTLMAGEIERSGRASQAAVDLLTALVADYPDKTEYRAELAKHLVFLGHSHVLSGDFGSGLQTYGRAAALGDDLMREEPDQPAHRRTTAEARRSLGYFYMRMSPPQAEDHFKAAMAATNGLPDTPDDRVLTANVSGAYGSYLVTQRRLADAEKNLRQGMALLEKPLPTRGMGRMGADMAAITLRTTLALLCFQTRRPEEGDRYLAAVIAELDGQSGDLPQTFPYRLQAVTAYQMAGQRRERAGDSAGALAASAKALVLCDALLAEVPTLRELPKGIWFQQIRLRIVLEHASHLARAGQRAEALKLVAELEAVPNLAGVQAYNVACLLAVLSEKAGPVAREALCRRAMHLLRKASATGYPANPTEIEHVLVKDPDMAPLRGRRDFKEWAAGLGKK
jgi:tetratricopeptide (TPR) repeat protein